MTIHDLDSKSTAALLLAQGHTAEQVSKAVNVSARTIRRWRTDTTFEADVQTARRAILNEAVAALGAAAREAIDTLRTALGDDSANIRVRAAGLILSALPSIAEHVELNERLTALEAAVDHGAAA